MILRREGEHVSPEATRQMEVSLLWPHPIEYESVLYILSHSHTFSCILMHLMPSRLIYIIRHARDCMRMHQAISHCTSMYEMRMHENDWGCLSITHIQQGRRATLAWYTSYDMHENEWDCSTRSHNAWTCMCWECMRMIGPLPEYESTSYFLSHTSSYSHTCSCIPKYSYTSKYTLLLHEE